MKLSELVTAVKDHAKENYYNGWDTIVEAYTDQEIRSQIQEFGTTSKEDTLAEFDELLKIKAIHETEIGSQEDY